MTHFDPSTGDVATKKNPDYWRAGYPLLDHLNFKISAGTDNRLNGLQGGQFDIMSDSSGASFDTVKSLPGITYQLAPAGRRELGMVLLNVSRPPLDDLAIRKAVVQGTDREALNEIANKGSFTLTEPGGRQGRHGVPRSTPASRSTTRRRPSRRSTAWKRAHGGKSPTFNLQSPADEMNKALSQEIKRQMAEIGIKVNLPAPVDQATIISQAIGNQVDSFLWRNYAGGDPDTLYPWFEGGSPLNFNKIDDPKVDAALAAGRSEPDDVKRTAIYEGLNRRLSTQAYNLYTWYENWYVAEQSDVKGVVGPNLPNADGKPGKLRAGRRARPVGTRCWGSGSTTSCSSSGFGLGRRDRTISTMSSAADLPPASTVAELIERRAGDDHVGLMAGDRRWTWREVVETEPALRGALSPSRRARRLGAPTVRCTSACSWTTPPSTSSRCSAPPSPVE